MLLKVSHYYRPALLVGKPAYGFSYFRRQLNPADLLARVRVDVDSASAELAVSADSVSPGSGVGRQCDPVDISSGLSAFELLDVLPHPHQRILHRLGKQLPVACQFPEYRLNKS